MFKPSHALMGTKHLHVEWGVLYFKRKNEKWKKTHQPCLCNNVSTATMTHMSTQMRLSVLENFKRTANLNVNGVQLHQTRKTKIHTGHRYNSENTTCQSELTRKSLIGSTVRDAQLEFQSEEYPRAGGKQESIRTPQTLLPPINLTYCITGLSLRIGARLQVYQND